MRKSETEFLSTLSDRFSMTVLFYIRRMMKNFYNGTAYDFDVQGIQETTGRSGITRRKWYDADTYICDPLISKADGKTLLLFFIPPQSQLQI